MHMVALRVSDNLAHELTVVAKKLNRSRSFIIRQAIETYLHDYIDYQVALDRLYDQNDQIISSEEMRRKLLEK